MTEQEKLMALWDFFSWRCDQLQRMLGDLALRLGQEDMVSQMANFHNTSVIDEGKKVQKEVFSD